MTRDRSDHKLLVGLLVIGYLDSWTWLGVVVHLGNMALHRVADQSDWLTSNSWALGASFLTLAGIYQFTPLKYRWLDRCRSPFGFITGHWTGKNQRLQALRLGLHHGGFCIGCCWSLMLLMFAMGSSSIGWMLILGALMAGEKSLPWGRRLSKPLGVFLLVWGVGIVLGAQGSTVF